MEVQHGIKCLVLPMDLSITDALKEIQQQNLYWHSWHPNKKKKNREDRQDHHYPCLHCFPLFYNLWQTISNCNRNDIV